MDLRELHWPLVIGLGALALVRPLARILSEQAGASPSSTLPIVLTIAVSAVWVAVASHRGVGRPVLTLLGAGLTYAVLSIALSGVLSPILTGELQGPLTNPVAIVGILVLNAVWGAACGALALGLRHVHRRAGGRRQAQPPRSS